MIVEATSFVSLTANMEPSEDRLSLNIGYSSGVVILAQFSDLPRWDSSRFHFYFPHCFCRLIQLTDPTIPVIVCNAY